MRRACNGQNKKVAYQAAQCASEGRQQPIDLMGISGGNSPETRMSARGRYTGKLQKNQRDPYMVVAWRIARLMRLGRTCPDLDASLFFDADAFRSTGLRPSRPC